MKQSDFIAFIQEILQRLKQKSPKFWKVWTTINTALLLIAGIPTALAFMNIASLNDILPNSAARIVLKIVAFAAAWGLFQNKLTVQSNHEVVVDNDVLLSKPCADLPFTEKKENVKVIEPKTEEIKKN